MKLNLGHYITFALIFFIAFIGYLATKAFQQNVDLVADDYYKQEVEFQQTINKKKNTSELSEKVKINIENESVLIYFPKDFEGKQIKGTAYFFNPQNQDYDVKESFTTESKLAFPITKLKQGKHTLKLSWEVDGVKYYFEELIIV